MRIDWFTVIAQVINFLILAWLLKRFLYKPVLQAINEREKRIAEQLKEAASKKAEAQKEREAFEQKNKTFDQQRAKQLSIVAEEAKAEKQRLFEEIRGETNTLRTKFQNALQEEQQNRSNEIKQRIQREVLELTGKALSGLASINIEAEMIDTFIKRLQNLSNEEKAEFKKAIDASGSSVNIKTAFDLPGEKKEKIEKAVKDIMNDKVQIQYQTKPGLVSGIEISSQQYKLSWSLQQFMDSLKKQITGK